MNNETPHQLDWQAFCYLADELSPDERRIFDERLADEQPAREALARAVEVVEATFAARHHEAVPLALANRSGDAAFASPRKRHVLAWSSLAVAVCLAAVIFASGAWRGAENQFAHFSDADLTSEPVASPLDSSDFQDRVAAAWSEARERFSDDSLSMRVALTDDMFDASLQIDRAERNVAEATNDSLVQFDMEEENEALPSWMIAAVDISPAANDPALP